MRYRKFKTAIPDFRTAGNSERARTARIDDYIVRMARNWAFPCATRS